MAKMKLYERTILQADGKTVTDQMQASKESDVPLIAVGYGDDAHVTDVQQVVEVEKQ